MSDDHRFSSDMYEMFRMMKDMDFVRTSWKPEVINKEDNDPRVSKFGGAYPLLPNQVDIPMCPQGCARVELLCQFYVPSLPEGIQKILPSKYQSSLIVISICPECLSYEEDVVTVIPSELLDQVIYKEIDQPHPSFQPRAVVGWKKFKSVPNIDIDSFREKAESFSSKYNIDAVNDICNEIREALGRYRTHLGGYPEFVQSDETPEGYNLLLQTEEDEVCTLMWGDCGTAQVWVNPQGDFKFTWACG